MKREGSYGSRQCTLAKDEKGKEANGLERARGNNRPHRRELGQGGREGGEKRKAVGLRKKWERE